VGASLPASATKAPPKTRASKPLHAPGDQPVTDDLGKKILYTSKTRKVVAKLGSR
jgi:hypothetical protein